MTGVLRQRGPFRVQAVVPPVPEYTVFMAQRRLRHYFQEHHITVVSSSPLADIIRNREATGRIAKWAVEIRVFDLTYLPRTAVDWTEAQQPEVMPDLKKWTMYFDGSKNYEGSGAGVVLISPSGDKLRYVLQIHFTSTNNGIGRAHV